MSLKKETRLVYKQCDARGRPVGESATHAKHLDAVVNRARQMRAENMSYTAISVKLGVARTTVQDWVNHRRRNTPVARVIVKRVPV